MAQHNLSKIVDDIGDEYLIKAKGLESQVQIALDGDLSGSATTDLSGNVTISSTIVNGAVTTSKIGDSQVTTAKINDKAVTLDKIADAAKGGAVSDNDGVLATHSAVKSYVDAQISGQGHYLGKQTVATINTWTADNLNNGDRVICDDSGTVTLGNIAVRAGEDLIFWKTGSGNSQTAIWQSMDGEFKLKQTAKTDPTASGTTLTAIATISQDANGEITATKKTIQDGTTSQKGVVQLTDSHTSTSTTTAATPKNVKEAYDLAAGKQDPITFDGTYNASTNKAATVSSVTSRIQALDATVTSSDGSNVQVKVTETDGKITAVNITTDNTATKVASATAGNFAGLDSNGDLTDSGSKASDFATSAQGGKADSAIQGVKLNGASSALTPDSNKVVTIPDAIATGTTGATNGLMTAADKQKLNGISTGANKVQSSTTNGNIKIDGTETTVYTHPSTTAADAAAVKVGKDALGHVVLGDALVKGDVGLGNVDNTADAYKEVLSATKLKTARNIDGVSFNGTANIHHYGECSTAGATAAKTVTLSDSMTFTLAAGAKVYVKFANVNGVASPTLSVNGSTAKPIYRYGTTAPGTSAATSWQAGSVVELVYSGSAWYMAGWLNDNTTYTNASLGQIYGTCTPPSSGVACTVTNSAYSATTYGVIAIKFDTRDVPASATLNINSKGAHAIYYQGAAIGAGVIKAGDVAFFMYDSASPGIYHLLGTDHAERAFTINYRSSDNALVISKAFGTAS